MAPIISVKDLSKSYGTGLLALNRIDLEIQAGEIFALLGANGAGKTTLIGAICGLVRIPAGHVTVAGHDIVSAYKDARTQIGLVPQELTTDAFETVWATVSFSRGLFGKPSDPAHVEKVLRALSLWDKKDARIRTLSGGMKRRVMIAKALAHEPRVLFLDEPSAGVDVALRKDMWAMVHRLRDQGVTIVLTTHYIEEAQEMADRVGVIRHGEIILVENKHRLMRELGKKRLTIELHPPRTEIPETLAAHHLTASEDGGEWTYVYEPNGSQDAIACLLEDLHGEGIRPKDLHTTQSSLEDIFVSLVKE